MHHGLKECARDHVGLFMRSYADTFGYEVKTKAGHTAKKKVVPSMVDLLGGSEAVAANVAALRAEAAAVKDVIDATKKGHLRLKELRKQHRDLLKRAEDAERTGVPWTVRESRKRIVEYAGLDPLATYRVARWLKQRLKKQRLWDWYAQVERPLTTTLMRMEDRGIRIDVDALDDVRKLVYAERCRIEHVVRASVGHPDLNLGSGPQLSKVLFDELGWEVLARNDLTAAQQEAGEDEGNPSLSKAALDLYEKKGYRLAKFVKMFRKKNTLHNVFLVGALEKRDASTGLIHTVFKQSRTVTGRLSSGDRTQGKMNLQNIPVNKEKDPYRLRRFFTATRPGYSLVVADYAQIELYILAQMSGDKRMVQAFQRGEDLHMLTAAKIFGLKLPKEPSSWDPKSPAYAAWKTACDEWKEKYSDERRSAKTVNFGLNYGMSEYKLANDFEMDIDEARKWIAAYFDLYPGVQKFMRKTIAFCKRNGYVTTLAGRRRRIPEIYAADSYVRGHAERQCINAPIQGSAADIIKIAMNALEYGVRYKVSERWCPQRVLRLAQEAKDLGNRMLLQVHDEIVGEAPTDVVDRVVPLVRAVMEGVMPKAFTDVAIKASVGSGPNWNEAKH
jgi:DNA polymerase-1